MGCWTLFTAGTILAAWVNVPACPALAVSRHFARFCMAGFDDVYYWRKETAPAGLTCQSLNGTKRIRTGSLIGLPDMLPLYPADSHA